MIVLSLSKPLALCDKLLAITSEHGLDVQGILRDVDTTVVVEGVDEEAMQAIENLVGDEIREITEYPDNPEPV